HTERVGVQDDDHGRLYFEVLTERDVSLFHVTGEGRAYHRIGELLLGEGERCLVAVDLRAQVLDRVDRQVVSGARRRVPRLRFVIDLAREQALLEEPLRAPVFLLRVGQIGSRLLDLRGLLDVLQVLLALPKAQARARLLERRTLLIDGDAQLDGGDSNER